MKQKRTAEELRRACRGAGRRAERVSIGELAELAGTRYSTAKWYTELGLIPYEQAGEGLQRYYKPEAAKRLKAILRLRAKRASVAEIAKRFGARPPVYAVPAPKA